jgi:hypothetical protein
MIKKANQNQPDNSESMPIDMRLMGTQEDLDKWAWFLELVESKGMITVLEKSRLYSNRGESKLLRLYMKIKLNR